MRVRVGCRFVYQSEFSTPMMMVVQPPQQHEHRLLEQRRATSPQIPLQTYRDSFGNCVWRLMTPIGDLCIEYDAVSVVPPTPDPEFPTCRARQLSIYQMTYSCIRCQAVTASPTCSSTMHGRCLAICPPGGSRFRQYAIGCTTISPMVQAAALAHRHGIRINSGAGSAAISPILAWRSAARSIIRHGTSAAICPILTYHPIQPQWTFMHGLKYI